MSTSYMLDTTVFNRILNDAWGVHALRCKAVFATHIQINEIQATRNPVRRAALLDVFKAINPSRISTESAVWDVSDYDDCQWSVDDGLFEHMLVALNRKNKSKANNSQDILIAETALRHIFHLVTDDSDLAEVFRQFGGHAVKTAKLFTPAT